jgi:hypothetical protein
MFAGGLSEIMKYEYVEGQKAQANFEEGMKALFKVPKDAVVKAEKKQRKKASRSRKSKDSDKG